MNIVLDISHPEYPSPFTPEVSRALAAETAYPTPLGDGENTNRYWPKPIATPVTITGGTTRPDTTWMDDAACLGRTGEMFPAAGPGFQRRLVNAMAICAECDVRRECHDYATATRQPDGVWGGQLRKATASKERTPMVHGTASGYAKHLRYPGNYGEPCDACEEAMRIKSTSWKRKNRTGRKKAS